MVMNEQAHKELSPKNRAALNKLTGLDISLKSAKLEAKFGELGMKKFRAIKGKQVINLSAAAQADFSKAAQKGVTAVLKGVESKGVAAMEIYNAMKN